MSENFIKSGQGHSISTSITKTSSHHRRLSSSFNAQTINTSNSFNSHSFSSNPASKRQNQSSFWRQYLQKTIRRFDALLSPVGPLLPHDRQGVAFGGTQQKNYQLVRLMRMRWLRFIALFYCIFSIFLSVSHTWSWLSSVTSQADTRFGSNWVLQRTYDEDKTYSAVSSMTHGLRMDKLFSKSSYSLASNIQPYWLKASTVPDQDDVSIITFVTPDTWSQLERLVEHWKGPVSVTLQAEENSDKLDNIMKTYNDNFKLREQVDVHLTQTPFHQSALLSRNAERNLARLFARTEFVLDLPTNVLPATDLRRTLDLNKEEFSGILRNGDLLVVPMFAFTDLEKNTLTVPSNKNRLLELVDSEELGLLDPHWKLNMGPTSLTKWRDAETLYPMEPYDYHYEAIVIESKVVQPWCSERFQDSRSACLLSSYLAGAELWVLPDDFSVQLPWNSLPALPDFESVLESRLYAKFHWEQCVHHARQLDGLGLWSNLKSQHLRTQCSFVFQSWGKGLISK